MMVVAAPYSNGCNQMFMQMIKPLRHLTACLKKERKILKDLTAVRTKRLAKTNQATYFLNTKKVNGFLVALLEIERYRAKVLLIIINCKQHEFYNSNRDRNTGTNTWHTHAYAAKSFCSVDYQQ